MKNNINWNFDNSYFRLPDIFRENIRPFSVKKPNLILLNKNLAEALNLNLSQIENKDLSLIFSGNSPCTIAR